MFRGNVLTFPSGIDGNGIWLQGSNVVGCDNRASGRARGWRTCRAFARRALVPAPAVWTRRPRRGPARESARWRPSRPTQGERRAWARRTAPRARPRSTCSTHDESAWVGELRAVPARRPDDPSPQGDRSDHEPPRDELRWLCGEAVDRVEAARTGHGRGVAVVQLHRHVRKEEPAARDVGLERRPGITVPAGRPQLTVLGPPPRADADEQPRPQRCSPEGSLRRAMRSRGDTASPFRASRLPRDHARASRARRVSATASRARRRSAAMSKSSSGPCSPGGSPTSRRSHAGTGSPSVSTTPASSHSSAGCSMSCRAGRDPRPARRSRDRRARRSPSSGHLLSADTCLCLVAWRNRHGQRRAARRRGEGIRKYWVSWTTSPSASSMTLSQSWARRRR